MPESAGPRLPNGLVVALDGPGSSGKSSVGAAAAARLGYRFCDTGLLYRAVTWLALREGIGETDPAGLVRLVGEVQLGADEDGRLARVEVGGENVTEAVRAAEVDRAVSAISRVPELRAALLERQRRIAAGGRIVMAGRDIGTVVLPDADLKVYIDASVDERARRRAIERGLPPDGPGAAEILEQLRARDETDATRPVAPLRVAPDAHVLRTDGNELETTVDLVVDAIRRREAELAASGIPAAEGSPPAAEGSPPAAEGSRPATEESFPAEPPHGRAGVPAAPVQAPRVAEPTGGPARPVRSTRPARPRAELHRRRPVDPTPIATHLTLIITVATFVMRVLARLLTRVRIEGDVNAIPRTGAVIIVANHASNADPVLIGGFLNPRIGRPMNWLGKREVFESPVLAWLAHHGGVHPVDRGAADIEAFRTAMRILEAGHILAVFPEGTRSPDGRLQAAKDGVTVLASRSGATVVPIGIADSDRLWGKGRRLPSFTPSVTVTIGEPFRLDEALAIADPDAAGDRRLAKEAGTRLIMQRIAALLPARQRGAYADPPPG